MEEENVERPGRLTLCLRHQRCVQFNSRVRGKGKGACLLVKLSSELTMFSYFYFFSFPSYSLSCLEIRDSEVSTLSSFQRIVMPLRLQYSTVSLCQKARICFILRPGRTFGE